jgi:hypothetical protein
LDAEDPGGLPFNRDVKNFCQALSQQEDLWQHHSHFAENTVVGFLHSFTQEKRLKGREKGSLLVMVFSPLGIGKALINCFLCSGPGTKVLAEPLVRGWENTIYVMLFPPLLPMSPTSDRPPANLPGGPSSY